MAAPVYVRGAVKEYGSSCKVLQGLDMTVDKGVIYALLGASGCGKTTLLNCIVGLRKLDSGVISVLGGKPGTAKSGAPGPRIGYMPQDIGLLGEFTVKGAIYYFGWLFGMTNDQIEDRYNFLSTLLHLPPDKQYVKTLSGGQQRRVSFAAALVQGAELLILDEPTVGLDPTLRHTIWEYLVKLCQDHTVTVIITTHYIEEARQANVIGLMRQGKLLAENTPQRLLDFYNCSSLEEVFLRLSIKQTQQEGETSTAGSSRMLELQEFPPEPPTLENSITEVEQQPVSAKRKFQLISRCRMKALLVKNFLSVLRQPGELVFIVLIPLLEITLFFGTIGGQPQGLKLAVVNPELGNYTNCLDFLSHEPAGVTYYDGENCNLTGLSCNYLSRINDSVVMQEFYDSREDALNAVHKGNAVGMMLFMANFSESISERGRLGREASPSIITSSEVQIHMDLTDVQVGNSIKTMLYDDFSLMAEEMAVSCNLSVKAVRLPLQIHDPVYGERNPKYRNFVAPGFIISVIYCLTTTLTASVLVTDRSQGVWHRSMVAGVTLVETLLAHVLCQILYVIIMGAVMVFNSVVVFGLECKGNLTDFILLVFLQGFAGMSYGLVISAVSTSYYMAMFFSLGGLLPNLMLSGVVWPIEGMPYLLRIISMITPSTLAINSLLSILERGWTFLQPQVLLGFLVTGAWILGHLGFTLLTLRLRT